MLFLITFTWELLKRYNCLKDDTKYSPPCTVDGYDTKSD